MIFFDRETGEPQFTEAGKILTAPYKEDRQLNWGTPEYLAVELTGWMVGGTVFANTRIGDGNYLIANPSQFDGPTAERKLLARLRIAVLLEEWGPEPYILAMDAAERAINQEISTNQRATLE